MMDFKALLRGDICFRGNRGRRVSLVVDMKREEEKTVEEVMHFVCVCVDGCVCQLQDPKDKLRANILYDTHLLIYTYSI